MAEEHIGSLVLIDCGPSLGTYQGRVSNVEPVLQTITLERPLRNGIPYQVPKVTLRAEDISDLRVLQLANEFEQSINDVLTSCRSGRKSAEVNNAAQEQSAQNKYGNGENHGRRKEAVNRAKTKVASKLQHRPLGSPGAGDNRKKMPKASSPNFSKGLGVRATGDPRMDEYAIGEGQRLQHDHQLNATNPAKHRPLSDLCAPLDHDLMSTDFDFETNLAKFEKLPHEPMAARAVLSLGKKHAAMIDNLFQNMGRGVQNKPSPGTLSPSKNIKHDENVVHDPTRVYVNAKRTWRYLTEDGMEVQSLTAVQKRELFHRASNGWITQDGFAVLMADSAIQLCHKIVKERNPFLDKVTIYVIFSDATPVAKQMAKHVSRYFLNRGHSVAWILTNGTGWHDGDPGVSIISDSHTLSGSPPSPNSFVMVIGRQGTLADDVSAWLLKYNFTGTLFVESDWHGVSSVISDEDVLVRLGVNGGSLVELPPRAVLCWQMPCEDVDTDLKSPVYICDINLPSAFLISELPKINQKSKPYKFPFTQDRCVELRKL